MITVTEAASREILRLAREQKQSEGASLRLFVKAGGCAGMSYGMDFERDAKPNDKVFEVGDIRVLMDPKSYMFLQGITIDYKESLMGRGFVFENPNASGACGCGTSFAV